jgi:hypothetical protein
MPILSHWQDLFQSGYARYLGSEDSSRGDAIAVSIVQIYG